MRVDAREGFAYHSVKLVLLANGNRYEVHSSTFFFVSGKALEPFNKLTCPDPNLFLTHISIWSLCMKRSKMKIRVTSTVFHHGLWSMDTKMVNFQQAMRGILV